MAYATVSDLADYLGGEPLPDNAATLLDRASVDIDVALIGAVYNTDDAGMPTGAAVTAALRDATCAQVHYWVEIGDLSGTNTGAGWRDVTIGKVRLSRAAGGTGQAEVAPSLAPAAVKILRVAGLLPVAAMLYG